MPKLIYSNSRDSNMFYAVKVDISSDSFFYLENGDKKYIFLDLREFEVFKEQNKNLKIEPVLLEPLFEKCDEMKIQANFFNKLALLILQEFKLENTEIEVPNNFPVGMADFLRSQKIKLNPVAPFFPERRTKTPLEISFIKENIKKTLKAFELIEKILRDSKIENDKIYFKNQILTSKFLKLEVEKLFLENNLVGDDLIISSGYQTAIPHHRGSGEIKPNSFIICDIFPKDKKTGYFADITRAFVKGKATDEMLAIFNSVKTAQIKAINSLKSGIKAEKIHEIVVNSFKADGFETKENQGFIHSAGHSFGLDIHEKPFLGEKSEDILQENDIVTIEPGLYFPKLGGVRIEDDILITKNGFENLVDYSKFLVIN